MTGSWPSSFSQYRASIREIVQELHLKGNIEHIGSFRRLEMALVDRRMMQKGIVVVGIVVAVVGLSLHFAVLGKSRSGFPVMVDGNGTTVEPVIQDVEETEAFFGIDVMSVEQSVGNCSVYLLHLGEYEKYLNGTSLDDLDVLLEIRHSGRGRYEVVTTEPVELYLVFVNHISDSAIVSYYTVYVPNSYFPTLSLGFLGVFGVVFGTAWYFTGWKRYFVLGLSVNLALFLIRIFTLTTYTLGLPEVFEELIHVELYNDYQFFYLSWVPSLWDGVWPYSEAMAVYLYPPLWIYTVGILGSTPSWLPGLVLFGFNAATGYLVCEISFKLTGDLRRSIFVMLLYLLNPFTLFYGSFMWLNPTPYVFFSMLAFLLAVGEHDTLSFAALAVATLYKQFAVVFFPILVILSKRKSSPGLRKSFLIFLRYAFVYGGIVLLVSIPFLIATPESFIGRMFPFAYSLDRLTTFIPDLWMPVHLNTFLLWALGPTWLTDVIAVMLANYIFLILSGLIVYGTYSVVRIQDPESDESARIRGRLFVHALLWSFVAVMCVQLFYPRGAYKFYLLALVPFSALLFDYRDLTYSKVDSFVFKGRYLFPMIMSWAIFLCYRFVYFWILGVWTLFYLWKSGNLSRIREALIRIVKPTLSDEDAVSVYEMIYASED